MTFGQPLYLWALLAALPAVAALFWWSWTVKQKLIRQFVRARLLENLTVGVSSRRQMFRLALLAAALAGALLALARPQRGYAWEDARQKGLDIIVAVDTSRSMLAQDVAPNRLEKAKLAAFDLMSQAKSDRLGLVAFAGNAFLQSPLTLDDQAFRQGVEALNVGIIPQGGTALSAALQTAADAFEKNSDNHKVIVLFTDGEDHDADTETLAAAQEAAKEGIHIFTVGVGTPEGELLRVRDDQGNYSFVKDDDGNVVKSRLNQTLLQQIATAANGFYLPLQGPDPMATLYQRGLAPLPKSEGVTRRTRIPLERYHWPLAFAILCLLAEFIIPESPRRPRRAESAGASSHSTLQKVAVAICVLLLAKSVSASPTAAYHEYQQGDFKSAFDEYSRLSAENTNDYRLHYDAGAAAYRAKELEKAEKQFNATLSSPTVAPDVQTQEKTYYNLGNTEFHLGEPLSDPDKKKERWQQAVDHYTQAIKLAQQRSTNDLDAQNNLAFVQRKLEELKQQQQQQKKQDKNQQDNKDDQDQQNQQQNQQKQDQKNQQQKQSKQNQKNGQDKKNEEQKKEQQRQEQAKKDQEKKDQEQQQQQEAQNKPDDKKDQQQEEAQQAAAGQMTPQEARQILASQKDEEKALIFAPENKEVKTQAGKIKDW